MNRIQLIADQKEWNRLAATLADESELAIDTEANSMYAYRGRICLIQIGAKGSAYLIDPLKVTDLSLLAKILAAPSVTKVMHGADYDLRSFFREYNFQVAGLFDTEIGARFLGMISPNLAAVLRLFLGVEIPKSRKLQRSNWGARPLSEAAIEYAAADVQYLIPLAAKLRQDLTKMGRMEWVQDEFQRLEKASAAVGEPEVDPFLKVKGSVRLNPQELAALKELHQFRELEAQRLDWPTHRVMRNETLIYLAQNPYCPLEETPDLSPQLVRRSGGELREARQRARQGPPVNRSPRLRRNFPLHREAQARLQILKQWRNDKGVALGLDPALLWPSASLERLAQRTDAWPEELNYAGGGAVRPWQRQEFSAELEQALKQAEQKHPDAELNN